MYYYAGQHKSDDYPDIHGATQNKKVDKITVKDVAEAATSLTVIFYYHFQDILDIIKWFIQQMYQENLEHSTDSEMPEKALITIIISS